MSSTKINEIEQTTAKNVAELNSKIKQAVKEYRYQDAENFDNEILEIKSKANIDKFKAIRSDFVECIKQIYQRHQITLSSFDLNKTNNELLIRKRYSASYEAIKKDHKAVLLALEMERDRNVSIEETRIIPEEQQLLDRSQNEALNKNYTEARILKEEADELGKRMRKVAIKEVQLHYENIIDEKIQIFKKEIYNLSEKLAEDLKQNKEFFKNEKLNEQASLKPRFVKEFQAKSMAISTNCETNNIINSNALKQSFDKVMNELGCKNYNL